ncbi:NADH pyrophosphatase NudC (nudix superfamily) [Peribacillus deserti]|uniref:NADH pyrophosphatase NudC (Nudix superfamily) n=1 Tax=Peribacillus deserti TaxID=673318 RepID=A0ABS2QDF0_9BACI|nr:NUDIX domain-containing protein [Peribacillus deserti]MBM7691168.1 NADH pyrophosphatase NudC (nudix superfamily) [Peribacillus deserti]
MFIVNVEGAIFKEDLWLIIKRSLLEEHAAGLLTFVEGKVDEEGFSSDILETSLKREIAEEVGVSIKNPCYINSSSFIADDGSQVINIVFLCEYESGEAYPKCRDEVESVIWISYEEIRNHPQSPLWLLNNLKQAEQAKRKCIQTRVKQ